MGLGVRSVFVGVEGGSLIDKSFFLDQVSTLITNAMSPSVTVLLVLILL